MGSPGWPRFFDLSSSGCGCKRLGAVSSPASCDYSEELQAPKPGFQTSHCALPWKGARWERSGTQAMGTQVIRVYPGFWGRAHPPWVRSRAWVQGRGGWMRPQNPGVIRLSKGSISQRTSLWWHMGQCWKTRRGELAMALARLPVIPMLPREHNVLFQNPNKNSLLTKISEPIFLLEITSDVLFVPVHPVQWWRITSRVF